MDCLERSRSGAQQVGGAGLDTELRRVAPAQTILESQSQIALEAGRAAKVLRAESRAEIEEQVVVQLLSYQSAGVTQIAIES